MNAEINKMLLELFARDGLGDGLWPHSALIHQLWAEEIKNSGANDVWCGLHNGVVSDIDGETDRLSELPIVQLAAQRFLPKYIEYTEWVHAMPKFMKGS